MRLLAWRRSSVADLLSEPGPDAPTRDAILRIAARAPDHRKVAPFRFILFEGEDRARADAIASAIFEQNEPNAKAAMREKEAGRFQRAPLVVAVISAVDRDHKTPEWEQVLTAGAVCQNMLLAASAFGFAAQWITEWRAYDGAFLSALGLGEGERVAGFIYIGAAAQLPRERDRPDPARIVSRFGDFTKA